MKSIKTKNHNVFLFVVFLSIVAFFLLLISKTSSKVLTQDTIEIEELISLMTALNEEKETEYQALLARCLEENSTSKVDDSILEEAIKILDNTGEIYEKVTYGISLEEIDRNIFFDIYENLIRECHKSDEIFLEEISIIGISEEEDETYLVTDKECGYCNEKIFQDYYGCQTKAYVKRTETDIHYLAVKEKKDGKIILPYIYVFGQNDAGIHILYQGKKVLLPEKKHTKILNDVVATLTLHQGKVSKIENFIDKINDKVLAIHDTSVTLEKNGKCDFYEGMKVYKIYDGITEGDISDVALGYEFVDFVVKDGKICACLVAMNEGMDFIRVLIKTTDFLSSYHQQVTVSCDSSYKVYENGENYTEYDAYEEVTIKQEDIAENGIVKIIPDALTGKVILKSIERAQGIPAYNGQLELSKKEEGIVVINEVLLEEYLYTVVPSEMPSYFQKDALMAQAICARTYAYTKMKNAGLKDLGAHLDDSTSYQVYNNIKEQVTTTSAVRDTTGIILVKDGVPIETQYYSTSCGLGTQGNRLNQSMEKNLDLSTNESFDDYIEKKELSDFESDEALYRWSYETLLDTELLENRLKECYQKNKNYVLYMNTESGYEVREQYDSLGTIEHIMIVERSKGGRAEKLLIRGSENTILLVGEYNIRYTLCNTSKEVLKQDGTTMEVTTLLPSAFFEIESSQKDKIVVGYSLSGGGFGHGNGMSQNGAGNMAELGYTYTDILQLFYEDCKLEQIY